MMNYMRCYVLKSIQDQKFKGIFRNRQVNYLGLEKQVDMSRTKRIMNENIFERWNATLSLSLSFANNPKLGVKMLALYFIENNEKCTRSLRGSCFTSLKCIEL